MVPSLETETFLLLLQVSPLITYQKLHSLHHLPYSIHLLIPLPRTIKNRLQRHRDRQYCVVTRMPLSTQSPLISSAAVSERDVPYPSYLYRYLRVVKMGSPLQHPFLLVESLQLE